MPISVGSEYQVIQSCSQHRVDLPKAFIHPELKEGIFRGQRWGVGRPRERIRLNKCFGFLSRVLINPPARTKGPAPGERLNPYPRSKPQNRRCLVSLVVAPLR